MDKHRHRHYHYEQVVKPTDRPTGDFVTETVARRQSVRVSNCVPAALCSTKQRPHIQVTFPQIEARS